MLSKIKNAASAVQELAAGSAAAAFDLAGAGVEQLNKALEEIRGGTGEIREAGYELEKLVVELGMVPKVGLTVLKVSDVDPALFGEILERNRDQKTLSLLLRSLSATDGLLRKVHVGEADVSRVELLLSVPPVARLHFHFPAGA